MSILKLMTYPQDRLADRLLYIWKINETNPYNRLALYCLPSDMYQRVIENKYYWGQDFGVGFFHIVIRFDETTDRKVPKREIIFAAGELINTVAHFNGGYYYSVLSIHQVSPESMPHFHLIMDNVDFLNGKRLRMTKTYLYLLKNNINELLKKHNITEIRMKKDQTG